MTSKAIVLAIATASLGFASLSFAQGHDGRDGRDNRRGPGHGPRVEHRVDHRAPPVVIVRPAPGPRVIDYRAQPHRGYVAHAPRYYRGGYVPAQYRGQRYVVQDWRARHLHAPQRGQQWVQVGSEYALIAIATGLIANVVLN